MSSYKVILVGDSAVGKTALVRRYMYDDFVEFHTATIVTSFVSKKFDGFRLDIWDSAGQERFKSLVQMYFRGTQTALVLFSAGDYENTFNQAKFWVQAVKEKTQSTDLQIILVENKIDLPGRCTKEDDVKAYANDNGLLYMKCSAKTGDGVTQLFDTIVQRAYKIEGKGQAPQLDVTNQKKGSKGCC